MAIRREQIVGPVLLSAVLNCSLPLVAGPAGGSASQPKSVATTATRGVNASRDGESMAGGLLWNSGSPLAGRPALGKDGRLRVASRQGSFDVITASGDLDYSVNLGAAPTGEVYVDERGWTYVGLATDKVVALSAEGRKQFTYPSPIGVRGNIGFAEGQGLLFAGHDGQVLGINRAGYPTLRLDPKGIVTAGPVGVGNWCVIGTTAGDVVWADRWGKRRRAALGAAVQQLLPSEGGGVWVLTANGLVALSRSREERFRLLDVVSVATSAQSAPGNAVAGAAFTKDGALVWLSGDGTVLARVAVGRIAERSQDLELTLDHEDRIWMTGVSHRLESWDRSGALSSYGDFGEPQYRPIIDPSRRQAYIATPSGRIFRIPVPTPAPLQRATVAP